eukprot:148669-Chlamydomonas_euryale.AAC.1
MFDSLGLPQRLLPMMLTADEDRDGGGADRGGGDGKDGGGSSSRAAGGGRDDADGGASSSDDALSGVSQAQQLPPPPHGRAPLATPQPQQPPGTPGNMPTRLLQEQAQGEISWLRGGLLASDAAVT